MEYALSYETFLHLAVILVAAKIFGILARKCHAPQVVGEIIAGLLIGPSVLGIVDNSQLLTYMSEIGVLMLMFQAGLGTNLKDLIHSGPIALLIACCGVLVPLAGGTLLYMAFYGFDSVGSVEFYKALFIGTILTATSVTITVATLKECGKLNSQMGTLIVSAAVIDDVIGIIVLTVVLSTSSPTAGGSLGMTLLKILLFLIFIVAFGFVAYFSFRWIDKRWPHTQRIPILGLALCFFLAYVSEHFFGVADITGAYAAGIILCNIRDAEYIDSKMNVSGYMLFTPIFFVGIGLKTNLSTISSTMIVFSVCFVLVALVTKIIGCGAAGLITRHKMKDCLKIGVGMMTRGEVALIVTQKGLSAGIIEATFFTPVILLIIVSSIVTPVVLKALFTEKPPKGQAA